MDRHQSDSSSMEATDLNEETEDEIVRKILAKIDELENEGPAGLLQVVAISNMIQKPIKVKYLNNVVYKIGCKDDACDGALELEYEVPQDDSEENIGHWFKQTEETADKELESPSSGKNDCLFNAIGAQVGESPLKLRHATVRELRKNIPKIVKLLKKVSEETNTDLLEYMVGGASYSGSSPNSAKKVLDKSQEQRDDLKYKHGHPRGHASYPKATEKTSSVENYSKDGWKTGFLSRADQDTVAHSALLHDDAQTAMDKLNSGRRREVKVEIDAATLGVKKMPQAAHFTDGVRSSGPLDIESVILVLRHFFGKSNDKHADVFVHTFYPVIPRDEN